MQQKSYEFTVSKVHEGQSFSSFKVLFRTVTGREPPTGKKNLDIVKKNLARYVEYRPLMEVDSTATSKRAVIITAIHEDPLPMEDHRGERGTYADFMRPLVLKLTEFEGKMYVLCNELGLFSRYFQEMQRSSVVKDTLGRNGEFEYNLWNTNEKLLLGEREYNALLYRQLRDVLKRTLDSLKKKGILEWGFIFKCQPDLFYDVGNGKYRKKSLVELKDEKQAYLQEIQKEAGRANALLNVELVVPLINGIDISNPFVRGKYTPYGEDRNEVVYCTLQQEEAIQNYQLYVRQLAYQKHFKLEELPKGDLEIITNEGKFFANPALARAYQRMDERLRPRLFGNIKFWKEVYYIVVDPEKAKAYRPEGFSKDEDCAAQVSKEVLRYMEKQLKKCEVEAEKRDLADITNYIGEPEAGRKYYLSCFKSAADKQKHLEQLYNMGEDETG